MCINNKQKVSYFFLFLIYVIISILWYVSRIHAFGFLYRSTEKPHYINFKNFLHFLKMTNIIDIKKLLCTV